MEGNPSHWEEKLLARGSSLGKGGSGATPSLEIHSHYHQFGNLSASFGLKETVLKESKEARAFLYLKCQHVGAEHRLGQHGATTPAWEEGEKAQPRSLDVAQSADSFSAAFGNVSSGKLVLPSSLDQTLGESSFWERGGVWGAEEQELWAHGMEEGSLLRPREVGR